jgi:tetratricopeptide (TPR) repeat protein
MALRTFFPLRPGRRLAIVLLGGALCAGCSSSKLEPAAVDPVQEALKAGTASYAKAVAGEPMASWPDLDLALTQFTKALTFNSRCADAYYERGKVFAALGLYELACEDESQAVQFRPFYSKAYLVRAEGFYQLRLLSRAIDDAREAIRQDPQQGSAYTLLGKAYFYSEPPNYLQAKNSLLVAERLDKHFDAADLIDRAEKALHPSPALPPQKHSSPEEADQSAGKPHLLSRPHNIRP